MRRKGIHEDEIKKRLRKASFAFPDALVEKYESIVNRLNLPDLKDRHVLAAAIKSKANIIVTNNIKDFPQGYLENFGLVAKTADEFLTDLVDSNKELALEAFRAMVLNRSNPNLDEFEILIRLRKNGLTRTAEKIQTLL